MGRARREVLTRLRVLGDASPLVLPTRVNGMLEVRTSLDPHQVVRQLQETWRRSPNVFRYTLKWVPVDQWTSVDLESMKQAVGHLRDRIAANETWRMTVTRRGPTVMDPKVVIQTLAALIPATVDLTGAQKIVRVELFEDRVAISVLVPTDVFSVRSRATRPALSPPSRPSP
jgi:tRNA(Ser,Leu) C12 N-acetylase TAN1